MRSISFVVALTMLTSYLPAGAQSGYVSIVSPSSGEILAGRRAEVSVSYSTGSAEKVTRIEIDLDGKPYATKNFPEPSAKGIASFVVDTTRSQNGSHSVIAKVYSGSTLIGSASGQCAISNTPIDVLPPTVKFVNIRTDVAYSGSAQIEVSARDGSDKDPLVSIMVDKSLKLIKNTPPYRYTWNTKEYENGKHTLQAYAFDEAGNRGDAKTVDVTVMNPEKVAVAPTQAGTTVAVTPTTPVETPKPVVTAKAVEPVTPVIPIERVGSSASAARVSIPSISSIPGNTAAARPDRPTVTATAPSLPRVIAEKPVLPPASTVGPTVTSSEKPMVIAEASPTLGDPQISRPSLPATTSAATESVTKPVVQKEPVTPTNLPDKKPQPTTTLQTAPVARIDQPGVVAQVPEPQPTMGPEPVPPANVPDSVKKAAVPAEKPRPHVEKPILMAKAPVEQIPAAKPAPKPVKRVPAPAVPAVPVTPPSVPIKSIPKDAVRIIKRSGVRIGQKVERPTLPEPVKMARAPKPELPTLHTAQRPAEVGTRLATATRRGSTVTSLRSAIEAAGGHIATWDAKSRTAVAVFDGRVVSVQVGKKTAVVAGESIRLSCSSFVSLRGRMMVDVRMLKSVLGERLEANERTGEYRILPA